MNIRSKKILCVFVAAILISSQQADAYEGFTINPYGAYLEGEAYVKDGFGPNSGIVLPEKEDTSSLAFGFTLTNQFYASSNGEVNIILTFHASDENCDVELKPNFISVARPFVGHIIGPGASTGLAALGGSQYISTANQPRQYWFSVYAPDGSYLQPGDAVNVGIFRAPQSQADTCTGDVVIQGIEVFYY